MFNISATGVPRSIAERAKATTFPGKSREKLGSDTFFTVAVLNILGLGGDERCKSRLLRLRYKKNRCYSTPSNAGSFSSGISIKIIY